MPDVNLTPARVAVLRAVADPTVRVYRSRDLGTFEAVSTWDQYNRAKKVTAICDWLEKHGLIRTGPPSSPSLYARRSWEITEAGAETLAALAPTSEQSK